MTLDTWADLVAQFSAQQIADADASVADADEFTDEQIYRLSPLFPGAGERVAASRAADLERGAA